MDWRMEDPRREELIEDVRRLAREGMTTSEIAEAIHVPESTVQSITDTENEIE